MIETTDKAGQRVYITYIPDCEDNREGYYCETYSDKNCDHKIDDFVIRAEDIAYNNNVQNYIRDFYKDEVLDLNYTF